MARRFGAETVDLKAGAEPVAAAMAFSRGRGVHAVIITASTKSNEPVHQATLMSRKRGRSMAGAWWLRRSIATAEELPQLMGAEQAREVLAQFEAESWVQDMTGPLADEPTLALAQIESMAYLRNQLLRDSDCASMDHSVELRTPLVDAHLLDMLTPYLGAFEQFPGKRLLSHAPKLLCRPR